MAKILSRRQIDALIAETRRRVDPVIQAEIQKRDKARMEQRRAEIAAKLKAGDKKITEMAIRELSLRHDPLPGIKTQRFWRDADGIEGKANTICRDLEFALTMANTDGYQGIITAFESKLKALVK